MNDDSRYNFQTYSSSTYIPLYKYYSNLNYAEDVILNKRIHLEIPSEYNDIFDSAIFINETTLKLACNTRRNICNLVKPHLPIEYHSIIDKCHNEEDDQRFSIDDVINYICSYDKSIQKSELVELVLKRMFPNNKVQAGNNKITCFSENDTSLLMWAYYANNHKGVCLKFDITKDELLKKYCYKVHYTNKLEYEMSNLDFYYRKSEQWQHEQEWRLVCDTNEEYLQTNSLEAIILGYRMPTIEKKNFIKLAKKHGLGIMLESPSKTKYELEIIEYIDGENNEI